MLKFYNFLRGVNVVNELSTVVKMNDEQIMKAIQKNGTYIENVEKTPERCLAAVKQNGLTLQIIPKDIHTVDLCLEAVKQNGNAIRFVSPKILTYKICLEAIKNSCRALSYIKEPFQTKELLLKSVKRDGRSLQYVPDKKKSKEICEAAVMQNGISLKFVPNTLLSKELFALAVGQNGLALQFVPSNRKSKVICIAAVKNNPLSLEYVTNRFKSAELCENAVSSNWRAFLYVSENMYTIEKCVHVLNLILKYFKDNLKVNRGDILYVKNIVSRLPYDINNNKQMIRLERQLNLRSVERKYFDKEIKKFITSEKICYLEKNEIKEFDSFFEFYNHLDGNLQNAYLYDYDFDRINLADFNIEGANICSDVLVSQQLYDNTFYANNISDTEHKTQLTFSSNNEVIEAISVLHDTDLFTSTSLNDNCSKIYYISDLHLNHKLLNAFPSHATEWEIKKYIKSLVKKMIDTAETKSLHLHDYLLIAGDVSYNFEISTLFYTELQKYAKSKYWSLRKIVVVLGNHELWDFNRHDISYTHTLSLDEIIQRYRELFSNLGICFLQNDLLLSDGRIISEEQLLAMTPNDLKHTCLKSSFVILGGLGFSGYNFEFNATKGIYRQTLTSLQDDIEETKHFESIYRKVRETLGKDHVIVLTHTPKDNWSLEDYNPNWTYVNGHTHRNEYFCDEEKTVYSDNQIGYPSTNIGLKHFNLNRVYDVFRYYPDGVYNISREQYLDFNRGVKISVTFNRVGIIHMLKRNNVYCFIFENPEMKKFFLLNGGMIYHLDHNDINYYFDRMSYYSDAVKCLLSGYNHALKSISNCIKQIGGTGTIHGCIVNIDFFNHIYVNPIDGTITPYFAWSIIDKYVYRDIESLLSDRCKDLYQKYIKLLDDNNEGVKLLKGETNIEGIDISRFVPETYMYKPSRIMKSLQYLTEVNVIRVWNDHIMDIRSGIQCSPDKFNNKGTLTLEDKSR